MIFHDHGQVMAILMSAIFGIFAMGFYTAVVLKGMP